MDIELKKLKKLEHALYDAIDILRDWQVEEVKQEEERFIVYLARPKYGDCSLTACAECMWEVVKKEFDAKTKLFVGTCDEAVKWYEPREKFTEIIKAWEDGKRIQVTPKGTDKWVDLHCEPTWDVNLEYRVKPESLGYARVETKDSDCDKQEGYTLAVSKCHWEDYIDHALPKENILDKPECPCDEGIDSKACAGCPQYEARKRKRIEERASKFGEVCVRPEYDDEECKKCNECIEGSDYRPFKNCDELVEFWSLNYQSVMRPANTKPFIWVRLKVDKRERLIVAFGTDFVEIGNKTKAVTLQKLFEGYEFLDGAVCGVKND